MCVWGGGVVRSCRDLSYSERLKKLGSPSLEYRRERSDIVQVYKILNDIDTVHKNKRFTMATYGPTRLDDIQRSYTKKDLA